MPGYPRYWVLHGLSIVFFKHRKGVTLTSFSTMRAEITPPSDFDCGERVLVLGIVVGSVRTSVKPVSRKVTGCMANVPRSILGFGNAKFKLYLLHDGVDMKSGPLKVAVWARNISVSITVSLCVGFASE